LSRWHNSLLFARVFCFAALVPVLLRFNLKRLEKIVEPRRKHPRDPAILADKVMACLTLSYNWSHGLVKRGCLTKGVTLYRFLRRAGLDVQLCFGAGRPDSQFAGHCWLVLDNKPYLEKQDPRPVFKEVFRIPSMR